MPDARGWGKLRTDLSRIEVVVQTSDGSELPELTPEQLAAIGVIVDGFPLEPVPVA